MTEHQNRPGRRSGNPIIEPGQKCKNFLSPRNASGLSLFGKWRRTQQDRLNDIGEIARGIRLLPDLQPDDLRAYLIALPCGLAELRKFDRLAADFKKFEREGRRLARWSAGRRRYARRREARIFETKIPTESTELQDCVNRVLTMYADIFHAALVIKQPNDDLFPWPDGAIIGMCADDPRAAIEGGHLALQDVRRVEAGSFEFVLPDIALLSGHAADMLTRDTEPSVTPGEFLSAVRSFFFCMEGWRAVLPHPKPEHYGLDAASGAFGVQGHDLVASGREAVL